MWILLIIAGVVIAFSGYSDAHHNQKRDLSNTKTAAEEGYKTAFILGVEDAERGRVRDGKLDF